ncbi:Zn(II)2Cys6 transcription factor domain-containing protein [Aspergillus foveolatus]|uniref:Zn(II)2Cys6 transcription factor domain-containing protein n=1 Tax=Aspergillus foveolatus TaxID=210207 RepID=UPI003CCE34A8
MTRQIPLLALSWLELIFFSCYYGGLAGLGYHSLWRIALRRRNVALAINLPTFWNVFNQFYGAAFVYPLYLLLEAVTTGFNPLYPVKTEISRSALLVSATIGSFLPFTFLWPAFHRSGTESRQRAIALYRFAPVVFSLLQIVGEKALGAQVIRQATSQASPYLVAGCAATVGHWYALGGAVVLAMRLSPKKGRLGALTLVLQRLYLPRSAKESTRLDASVLARAAHEFLQYDILVLVAAYIPTVLTMSSVNPSSTRSELAGNWERLRKSCDTCQEAKVKCSQHKPSCHRCLRHRQPCVYSPQRRSGRPPKRPSPSSRLGPESNNSGDDIQNENTIQRTNPNANISNDSAMTDAGAVDPRVLTGDFAASSGIDPVDDIFQTSFESFLADSLSPKGGLLPGSHSNPTTPNGFSMNSPSITDPFGAFPFLITDHNLPIAALSSHVPPIDQLPVLSAGASNTSSECGDCGAKCYSSLLQHLLFLRQTLPESTRPSIDVIMQAEGHVRALLDRILGCNACLGNRSSVLLISAITERIVQMLDWIIEEKTLLDTENMRYNRRTFSSWGRPSRLPPHGFNGMRRNVCHVSLRVGNTELDEDAKQYFLKNFILLRLKKLAVKVQEVRRTATTRPGDCIYRAAELVLADSIQRLDYLRGQCQLWE